MRGEISLAKIVGWLLYTAWAVTLSALAGQGAMSGALSAQIQPLAVGVITATSALIFGYISLLIFDPPRR